MAAVEKSCLKLLRDVVGALPCETRTLQVWLEEKTEQLGSFLAGFEIPHSAKRLLCSGVPCSHIVPRGAVRERILEACDGVLSRKYSTIFAVLFSQHYL